MRKRRWSKVQDPCTASPLIVRVDRDFDIFGTEGASGRPQIDPPAMCSFKATRSPSMLARQWLGFGIFHNSLDHLVAHAHSVLQTWCKVTLNVFETVAISLKGTE